MSNIQSRSLIEVRELATQLRAFADARDWGQFHSPKKTSQALRHELADVVMYAVRLADVLAIDLDAAVKEKLALNEQKYPVELARGTSAKYNELPGGEETQ